MRIPDHRTATWMWLKQRIRRAVVDLGVMVIAGIGWCVFLAVALLALVTLGALLDPLFPVPGAGGEVHPVTVGPGISSDYWGAGCDPAGDVYC